MRTKYQIMSQEQGEEARVLFTSTRKRETEKFLCRLIKGYNTIEGVTVQLIREGYAKMYQMGVFSQIETELWICKA